MLNAQFIGSVFVSNRWIVTLGQDPSQDLYNSQTKLIKMSNKNLLWLGYGGV